MATLLNDPGCTGFSGANTALPGCPFFPDQIVGAILIPETKVFTNAELDTFITTCQGLMIAAAATRIYPVFRFDAITDNTPEPTFKQTGYMSQLPIKDGKYDWTFELYQGGLYHQMQLRKFNGSKAYKVLLVDAKNIVYGVRAGTTNDDLAGFTLDYFHAYTWKVNTGEDQAKFMVRFGFARPDELGDKIGYFDAGVNVEDNIRGILDVELVDLGTEATTKTHTIGIRTVADKVNLYDAYSADFDADHFTATLTGAADNPTVIAANATKSGWTLTFPTVGVHIVTLASAVHLAADSIGGGDDPGYEAIGTLTITVD